MSDQIRVNENQLSWGSIKVKIAGELYTGFFSLTYGDKRERVKAYGMGRHHAPRGRSRGKYTVDPVKIGGYRSSVQAVREALAAQSRDGLSYGDTECQIVATYFEADEIPIIAEINRCVWVSSTVTDSEDAENLKEEIEFDALLVRRNGLVLFDASEGNP